MSEARGGNKERETHEMNGCVRVWWVGHAFLSAFFLHLIFNPLFLF